MTKPKAADTLRHFATTFETRDDDNPELGVVVGYASVFDKPSQPLGWDGFIEYVAPGAFTKSIQESDVRALWNHDANIVLGRNRAGTLALVEDHAGLKYTIDVDLGNTQSRDVYRMIKRGDVSQSSFGFEVLKEEWVFPEDDAEPIVRILKEARLWDVSPVTFPAYLDTSVETDSFLRSLAGQIGKPVAELTAAHGRGELRSLIRGKAPEPPAHGTPSLDAALRRFESLKRHPRSR